MAERRRYTARQRAKAVGIATVEGVTAAERQTGIPKETIQYWTQKPEFAQLRTTARETVIEQLWIGIQVGIEVLTSGLKGDAPLNHKADALRTLAERYALLNGEATTRTENRELHDKSDDELRDGVREAERILASGRDAAASEVPPEG
jgi:hypothetical protein